MIEESDDNEHSGASPNDEFAHLTTEQKQFADKVFLQLISRDSGVFFTDGQMSMMMQQSIRMALLRTSQYNRRWDMNWAEKFN